MIPSTSQFSADFKPHGDSLNAAVQAVSNKPNARTAALDRLIAGLPEAVPSCIGLDRDWVTVGRPADLTTGQSDQLRTALNGLKPWRKGPFDLFGIRIDSEWNSALKWHRVAPHLNPLQGRKVLDVGCSNGYYLFRMAQARPRVILGIEPYAVYYYQFLTLQRYLGLPGIYCLPLGLEDLPEMPQWFDTVLCMGILYHRRSPLETLSRLKEMLVKGGQLILETLIIPGKEDTALFPRDRYARMRNVYFLPTANCLQNWLTRCGFKSVRCVDITPTTPAEQRKTPWIDSQSLDSCIDPNNNTLTVEGYPAPTRAVVIAERK